MPGTAGNYTTKDQLIANLKTKPWVKAVFKVEVTKPAGEDEPANLAWYRAYFIERLKDAMWKRHADFYVLDEGTESEDAAWIERVPEPRAETHEFRDWLTEQIRSDPEIQAFRIKDLSEEADAALVVGLIADPDNPSEVIPVAYQCVRVAGAFHKSRVNATEATIARIF